MPATPVLVRPREHLPSIPLPGAAAWLRRRLLGIDPREATFERRGFHAADPVNRARLEGIGLAFLRGYHAALDHADPARLGAALDAEPSVIRGFAYEGAGMALALLDTLAPWRGRTDAFLRGPGGAHVYMVNVGAGWAMARLRRRLDAPPAGLDPLLGWLALDGYGFHEGYFHPARTTERREVPRRLGGYARRAFDQGLGRSLWFSRGADPRRVAAAVRGFDARRGADLWSGVGLACAYAGGADAEGMEILLRAAGTERGWLAQGAAFAAGARQRAGNPAPHTDAACRALAGVSAEDAAAATDEALRALGANRSAGAYERWRTGVYGLLAGGAA